MLLAGSAGLSATGAHAALTTFQMGMLYSGTPAFDSDDAPGHDSSASNAVIRTFDAVAYNLALASYNGGAGNIIKAQKLCGGPPLYAEIMACLHQVTGRHAKETRGYAPAIRLIYKRLTL